MIATKIKVNDDDNDAVASIFKNICPVLAWPDFV